MTSAAMDLRRACSASGNFCWRISSKARSFSWRAREVSAAAWSPRTTVRLFAQPATAARRRRVGRVARCLIMAWLKSYPECGENRSFSGGVRQVADGDVGLPQFFALRSEEHTSELQSQSNLVWRLLLEKKKKINK